MREIPKVVQKLSRELESVAGTGVDAGAGRNGTKTLSHPRYTGVT